MNFKLIKTLEIPKLNDYMDFYNDDWDDKVQALEAKADFFKITLSNCKTYYAGLVNFNGGLCDCCKELSLSNVAVEGPIKIEAFKEDK